MTYQLLYTPLLAKFSTFTSVCPTQNIGTEMGASWSCQSIMIIWDKLDSLLGG